MIIWIFFEPLERLSAIRHTHEVGPKYYKSAISAQEPPTYPMYPW